MRHVKRDRELCRQLIKAELVLCKYCGEKANYFLHFNKNRVAAFCCKEHSKQCKGYKIKQPKLTWNTEVKNYKIKIKNETYEDLIYRLNQIIKKEKELNEIRKYSNPIPIDFLNKFKKIYKVK